MSVPSRRWGNHPKSRSAGETSNSNSSSNSNSNSNSNGNGNRTTNVILQSRQSALNVNIKNYLGLQQAMSCSLDTCPEGDTLSFSTSPVGIISSSTSFSPHTRTIGNVSGSGSGSGSLARREPSRKISQSPTTNRQGYANQGTNSIGNSSVDDDAKSSPNRSISAFKPTILLEDIPHDVTHTMQQPQQYIHQHQHQRPQQHQPELRKRSSTAAAPRENHRVTSSAAKFRQQAFAQDFANQVAIDADLDDIDNSYMMSIYMNEESSIYTKGTASTASTSSSSVASKRSRHPGASHKRREHVKLAEEEQPQKESGFVRSMKQSSSSFFVEGNWSEKYGWYISKKWDATPGESWDQPDPIFDKKEERLVDI